MAFKNDMTTMYTMHDALRRDLEHITSVTARPDDDPKQLLRTATGWEMFKSYLTVHHTAEDDMLWPRMREVLGDDSDGVALLDAMEAEHAAIVDRDTGPRRLGELTDALATALRGHLAHEEAEGLALIDATVTDEQWRAFGVESGKRLGGDVRRFMPWMLDGASPDVIAKVVGAFPPPLRQAYQDEWQPAYATLTLWP
jgi:hypothetical protein